MALDLQPPVNDALIAPSQALSSSRLIDYCQVLIWTFWAPLMFVHYNRRFVLNYDANTIFPSIHHTWEIAAWRRYNPEQWALVTIALRVGLLLLGGLALLNPVFLVPILGFTWQEVWIEATLLTLSFFGLLALQMLVGWIVAGWRGNIGYLLMAALPGGVALAFMLLFALWVQHLPAYVAANSPMVLVVFALWGYATGFYINFFLAVTRWQVDHLTFLLLGLVIFSLASVAFLLSLRGITWSNYQSAFITENRLLLKAGFCWGFGLILGVVGLSEWLLYSILPLPRVTDLESTRAWTLPGSTLLPVDHLQHRLDEWLQFDWQHGVHIVARASRISRQQRPLSQAVRGRLDDTGPSDLPAKLATLYDSGMPYLDLAAKPPPVKTKRFTGKPENQAATPPPRQRNQHRYQQETLLAHAANNRLDVPVVRQDGEQLGILAAYWYYNRGYLHRAADILAQLDTTNGSSSQLRRPSALSELSALVATFQVLLDLATVSRIPTAPLPPRPSVWQRTQAWDVVDRFVEVARWAWRTRRCQDPQRSEAMARFYTTLRNLERLVTQSTLAERKLVLGIINMWRRQFPTLLRTFAVSVETERVILRPWYEVYPELGDECPWRQLGLTLCPNWLPGLTIVSIVSCQPLAGLREAIIWLTSQNVPQTSLAWCDEAEWARRGTSLSEVCRILCETIAEALEVTDMIPSLTALRSQPLVVTRTAIQAMCRLNPARCLVLALPQVESIELLMPSPQVAGLFSMLGDLEERITNLSLVLQTRNMSRVARWLASQRFAGVTTRPANAVLLSAVGVQNWLSRQFDTAGVWFDPSGSAAVAHFSGGHPYLVDALAQCVCDVYNTSRHDPLTSPIIDWSVVHAATQHEVFKRAVREYCPALARELAHDRDPNVRLLLYTLAQVNANLYDPIDLDGVVELLAGNQLLSTDYIITQFSTWLDIEVLGLTSTPSGPGYYLRCLAFAEWLLEQGSSLPLPVPTFSVTPSP